MKLEYFLELRCIHLQNQINISWVVFFGVSWNYSGATRSSLAGLCVRILYIRVLVLCVEYWKKLQTIFLLFFCFLYFYSYPHKHIHTHLHTPKVSLRSLSCCCCRCCCCFSANEIAMVIRSMHFLVFAPNRFLLVIKKNTRTLLAILSMSLHNKFSSHWMFENVN